MTVNQLANAISGPWMICTRAAFGVVGLSWANRLPLKTMIDNVRSTFFIFTPQRELTKNGSKRSKSNFFFSIGVSSPWLRRCSIDCDRLLFVPLAEGEYEVQILAVWKMRDVRH